MEIKIIEHNKKDNLDWLLFVDETIQPDSVYQMSGNKIRVRTLDLNGEFSVIADQLKGIVDEHFTITVP